MARRRGRKANRSGRNQRCWCGNGKKFKKCHCPQPAPAEADLAKLTSPPQIDQNLKVEIAKAMKQVRACIPDQYEDFKRLVEPPELRVAAERTVSGLAEEDEFGLMCRLMGTTTHLVKLDQSPLVPGESIAPDLLGRFQPGAALLGQRAASFDGFRCLIEVKSTEAEKCSYKLGGSLLRRRREFADAMGLPLLLAVRFLRFRQHALWVICEDADRSRTSIRAEASHFVSGLHRVLWDDYGFLLSPRVFFVAVYDKAGGAGGITHPRYGTLREYRVMEDGGRVIIRMEQPDATFASLFFQCFDPVEQQVEREGTLTYRFLIPANRPVSTAFLSNCVYRMNCLPTSDDGSQAYDPTRIAAGLAEPFFTRRMVEALADPFVKAEALFFIGIGDNPSHEEAWTRLGGRLESKSDRLERAPLEST